MVVQILTALIQTDEQASFFLLIMEGQVGVGGGKGEGGRGRKRKEEEGEEGEEGESREQLKNL